MSVINKIREYLSGTNTSTVIIGNEKRISALPPGGGILYEGGITDCKDLLAFWKSVKDVNLYSHNGVLVHQLMENSKKCSFGGRIALTKSIEIRP